MRTLQPRKPGGWQPQRQPQRARRRREPTARGRTVSVRIHGTAGFRGARRRRGRGGPQRGSPRRRPLRCATEGVRGTWRRRAAVATSDDSLAAEAGGREARAVRHRGAVRLGPGCSRCNTCCCSLEPGGGTWGCERLTRNGETGETTEILCCTHWIAVPFYRGATAERCWILRGTVRFWVYWHGTPSVGAAGIRPTPLGRSCASAADCFWQAEQSRTKRRSVRLLLAVHRCSHRHRGGSSSRRRVATRGPEPMWSASAA